MSEAIDIVGSGWRFPLAISARGGIALTQQHEEIEQAIAIILSTPPGHRQMRPAFGCRIHELLFAPMNAATLATAARFVEEAIGYWEPRVELVDVQAAPDRERPGRMLIAVVYRIRATHDERALVYPFYSIPDEG